MRKTDISAAPFLDIAFTALILLLFSAPSIAGMKKSTIEIKEDLVGVIGYGTLMSKPSMEQSLGHKYEGPTYLVHLKGYVRGWAYRRPNNDPQANGAEVEKIDASYWLDNERIPFDGTVNLNIYPEKNSKINGILYLIAKGDLLKIDKRERGYKRVDVTHSIEEYDFSGGKVYVYEGLPEHPDTSSSDPGKYIIVKEYVDQVTKACDSIGKKFRPEFDKSTRPIAYQVVSFEKIVWKKPEN